MSVNDVPGVAIYCVVSLMDCIWKLLGGQEGGVFRIRGEYIYSIYILLSPDAERPPS